MANWFTRVIDTITPWDRGGEVQRREERKRREEEQRQNQPRPTSRPPSVQDYSNRFIEVESEDQPKFTVKPPENRIGTLKVNNQLGRLNNTVSVFDTPMDKPVEPPKPGTIVKPRQTVWDKVRDQFDANTQADQYRREQGNIIKGEEKPIKLDRPGNIVSKTPLVGHGVKLLNTMGTEIPRVGITLQNSFAQNELSNAINSGDKNRIMNAQDRVASLNRQVDAANAQFRKNDGGLFNAGTLYDEKGAQTGDIMTGAKDIMAPTAVAMLDLISLGKGATIEQMIRQGGWQSLLSKIGAKNIGGASAANFGSGSIDTASQGGSMADSVKSGLINTALGIVPDVLLPAGWRSFRNKVSPQIYKSGTVNPADLVDELDDTAISASAEAAAQTMTPRPITVTKDIPIDAPNMPGQPINVRNLTEPKPLIKEFPGDADVATPDALIKKNADDARAQAIADRAWEQKKTTGKPDYSVDGVKPVKTEPFKLDADSAKKSQDAIVDEYAKFLKDMGQGNGTQLIPDGSGGYIQTSNNLRYGNTKGKRMTKQDWLDEAKKQIEGGQAPDELRRAYNDAADPEIQSLLAKGEQPDTPVGKPIQVKESRSIPVRDETVAPQGLPEQPGTVRATTATAPAKTKAEAVASQPVTAPIEKLPKVGSKLPDGTVVTKRMVASARNQRKLAKQLAKTQEQTTESLRKLDNNAPKNALDSRQPGIIKSDEIKKGKAGPYQVAHQADQTNELGTKSVSQVIDEADANVKANGSMTDRDVANVKAALDTTPKSDPAYKKLATLYHTVEGTHAGQRLALRNAPNHRVSSSKEVSNHAISKIYALADDPTKITDDMISSIQKTADDYVNLRDASKKAADDFNANPTPENYNRFIDLDKQAAKAEKQMGMAQYNAAKKSLKGNSDPKAKRMIEDAADDADMYTMDFVDSALLSSTGTFVRNFVNASLGSLEEGLFGGVGARTGNLLTRGSAGGGIGRGSLSGFGKGASNIVDASKTRAKNAGWNPIEHMKNWSTTGNQLGDSMIEGSIGRSVRKQYENMLKKQGYKGNELRMRADVMARTDPDNLARDIYAPQARKDAGLGSGISKRSSPEKYVQRAIADGVSEVLGGKGAAATENITKALTRIVLGFPSAVGRSLVAGSQRIVPLANVDTFKVFTAKSPTLRSAAIKESIKKSGSAATVATIFYGLGANGNVTGAYPKDQNERDRWEREGIKENSIKIGDAWYDIPSYMGSFGLPALVYASIGKNGGLNKDALNDIKSITGALSPTDGINKINDMLDGRIDFGKYTQSVASSAGKMSTPYGSLLNQLSKVFDPTQKDTSSDTWLGGTLNKLMDGIPILDKRLPDKTDKEGNVLYNPSVIETMAGAAGAVQKGGEERSKEINTQINDKLSTIKGYGAFDDPNFKALLEGEELSSYKKVLDGKQLDESDIKQLTSAFVKGVSAGTDTAYLERGQYDTNLTALKMKRDMMSADPTVAPSKLEDIEVDIKRGEIYKKNKTPYQDIIDYKSVGVEEWRKMGDPDSDEYDPDMYQKLWDIDQAMTKAGVSYKKGALDKNKYYQKESKSGSRRGSSGSSGKSLSVDFGKLSAKAPKIKEYETLAQTSGTVPRIRRKQPNIVHAIKSGRL